ncbi:MAG: hypothetical protein QOC66_4175, partial [Pseudonocardiales bacterium]|nr:hypothetical protein [Pseudonocardiales bacterium]
MRSALTRVVGLAAVAAVATGSDIVPDPSAGAAVVSAARHRVIATRTFLDANGHAQTVATNKITMTVSQTANLRGRQEITVKWSGARPTGGAVADVNSSDGASEEYPFVLLECRGTDSTAVPKSQRLSPQTCWTQTWSERFQSDNTTGYPAWRSDMQAPAAERAAAVNTPNPRPKACFRAALAERWVPFVAADGTTYPGGSVGCAGMAPESSNVGGTGIPSNATYAITGADGTGSAEFDVWTADENASLGCTDTVACSLVAIPIEGVSCDAFGTRLPAQNRPSDTAAARADATCRAPDGYRPGQLASSGIKPNPAVTGALWWSASNWRNRIAVPLTFATPASICSVVSTAKPLAIYGSILMNEATAQ